MPSPESVKQQLTGHGLVSEEWGGETIMVTALRQTRNNIEQLLEMILLVAEVQDLRAQADITARGAVVDRRLDKQRGPVATVLVQQGTLHVGMPSRGHGLRESARNGRMIKAARCARPARPRPVEIAGLSEVPVAGDLFEVMDDERKAREMAEERQYEGARRTAADAMSACRTCATWWRPGR